MICWAGRCARHCAQAAGGPCSRPSMRCAPRPARATPGATAKRAPYSPTKPPTPNPPPRPEPRQDKAWRYWKARALLADKPGDSERAAARQLLQDIAGTWGARGFYEQLAQEELGQRITLPPPPPPLSAQKKRAAPRPTPGPTGGWSAFWRARRGGGGREGNYTPSLYQSGGMPDRELLAAAAFACQHEVWDRCINTSKRTKGAIDIGQSYPTPFRKAVLDRAHSAGIDPAYVYGLTSQESRFVIDARSHAGAGGLMQVRPATARWTDRKTAMTELSNAN